MTTRSYSSILLSRQWEKLISVRFRKVTELQGPAPMIDIFTCNHGTIGTVGFCMTSCCQDYTRW